MMMYMILINFADNTTGITHIGYSKLMNYLDINKELTGECLKKLSELGLIYYKSGYGYGENKDSNAYIFPYEQWILPASKDEYDNYILHPERYSTGTKSEFKSKKGSKGSKQATPTGQILIDAPIDNNRFTEREV